MQTIRTIRNFAFVVMLGVVFVGMEARVLAMMGGAIGEFCDGWEDGEDYDCVDCYIGTGFPPSWGASGSCDFSGIEDEQEMLQTAATYCDDSWSACDETCEDEYQDWLADYYSYAMSTEDPCYAAATNPNNWWTWGNGSCNAGENSNWSCSCGSVFMGEC